VRLGTAPVLGARLLVPQIHRRQPDAKTLGDYWQRHTSLASQQYPLAQIS
jgi:hypothetical protein